ncbi:hypothetical protein BT96DRAFT_960677 [Gymnopus androsaceus JB14]|uniref:Uncharacterized protein n=1 Tax=Gymnopus androsaceus JB14 TaxID=1447944 RepID=A0A6A4GJI2_9AGAR|nr:hypothetical protein BT96DRAFT_960677 [Gymnopus androsaceus JB14]
MTPTCLKSSMQRTKQNLGDRSATSNLKKHAVQCFSQDPVDAATKGASPYVQPNGLIFTAFGCQGAKPVTVTHCTHSNAEIRTHLDCQFQELMLAGRPQAQLPSGRTVAHDIRESFECCEDAWTSPNHRAMAAWTVHLHHEGYALVFFKDIFEVPRSHTGETLATEFYEMLVHHGLQHKCLYSLLSDTGFHWDNALLNDTQTEFLDQNPNNSFDAGNQVCCFNHTLNLACKSFLKPFGAEKKKKDTQDLKAGNDGDDNDDDFGLAGDDNSLPDLADVSDSSNNGENDDNDDVEDKFERLGQAEHEELVMNTEEVHSVIFNV